MTRSLILATCHYSFQPRDGKFVKDNGFLSFVKNKGKNIGLNKNKDLSSKVFDHAKKSASDELKTTLNNAIQKTAEATADLIGNNICR